MHHFDVLWWRGIHFILAHSGYNSSASWMKSNAENFKHYTPHYLLSYQSIFIKQHKFLYRTNITCIKLLDGQSAISTPRWPLRPISLINFSRSYEYFSEDGGKGFSFLGLKWPHWSAKWPGLSIYTT